MKEEKWFQRRFSRRGFLGTAAGIGAGVLASTTISPSVHPAHAQEDTGAQGNFNWLTWSDHYFPDQLTEAATKYNIKANPSLFSDNSEAFLKVQQVGGAQIDMVSGDALWVPKFYEEGLIEPFDLWALQTHKDLWDEALFVPFWKTEDGMDLAFPFGWSPVVIAYNPKYVQPDPDSWEVLWDPKYKGRVAMEQQPFDVMGYMAKALGFKEAFRMTPEQLEQAKKALIDLMPNVLKFMEQQAEAVTLLADESAWLVTGNLGLEDRVKDVGGPEIRTFVPKEGTIGWMDGEMIVKDAVNKDVALNFLDKMQTPEWIARNFLEYGRPLFNREAYHWLVKNGHEERAKRYMMDKPEIALSMTLKGPAEDLEATISAFNEALASVGL